MSHRRAGTPPAGDDSVANQGSNDAPRDTVVTEPAVDGRTIIAGRYAVDLQSPPEAGAVSVTYRGRDLRTRDPIVVRTLRMEYRIDPDIRARFRREARLLQFLSHPNVIRALSYSEERGSPWLVLESVLGRSLRDIIARDGPLSPEAIVPILNGLAAALDHLHARGLVHLDVRPENVVVATEGEVKLVDFGLAQTSGTVQEPIDGVTIETVAYTAPERSCGEPVTPETDVYALGCIVYEMLTGEPPAPMETMATIANDVIRARLDTPLPPPSRVSRVTLPAWVDDIVLGALDRDPRKRYGSAGSFSQLFLSGVEGDVDVETGRPRPRVEPTQGKRFPLNEPGIAMKGSLRLARRRGEGGPAASSPESGTLDAAFTPLPRAHLTQDLPLAEGGRRWDLDALSRRLWQAMILAALLNFALIAALVFTRGEIPSVWSQSTPIGPGSSVQIAGAGLVAREGPNNAATIVADLPPGGSVRITGPGVPGEGGLWWPMEVDTQDGPVQGYVPESWLQAP